MSCTFQHLCTRSLGRIVETIESWKVQTSELRRIKKKKWFRNGTGYEVESLGKRGRVLFLVLSRKGISLYDGENESNSAMYKPTLGSL